MVAAAIAEQKASRRSTGFCISLRLFAWAEKACTVSATICGCGLVLEVDRGNMSVPEPNWPKLIHIENRVQIDKTATSFMWYHQHTFHRVSCGCCAIV